MPKRFPATAEGLVEFAIKCLNTPNIYIWGGVGEYVTDSFLDETIAKWPDWYTPERVQIRREMANRGLRGWDCIGMIQSYTWGDYHQDNTEWCWPEEFLTTWKLIEMDLVKGDIATLPERPGLVLWKKGHVGVYIGNGEVIESNNYILSRERKGEAGVLGGIVKSRIEDQEWTYWLQFPGIAY